MPERFNRFLRSILRASAWVMAPICLGLALALLLILAQFGRELWHAAFAFREMTLSEVILSVLRLIDLALLANLVVMIIGAGIEIYAPLVSTPGDDRPEWTAIINFAELKPKLFASISAIAAIYLLEAFVNLEAMDKTVVLWEAVIVIIFVLSTALLAWTAKMSDDH